MTTAAALVLTRDGGTARYLTAPWIAESTTRDLRKPDSPARPLHRTADGVTDPVPVPDAVVERGRAPSDGAGCGDWPALQLRSSERIVERHAFLVTDLGEPTPVHLTYTPHPSHGGPARRPREAVSEDALRNWAGSACELATLRGKGVRAVNNWEFAHQNLPGDSGRAVWVCTRADTWRGPGSATVQFLRDGDGEGEGEGEGDGEEAARTGRGTVAARAAHTAACSRFGQHVLAGLRWKSDEGRWYQLAAGSRAVTGIEASGAVEGEADGPTLALRTDSPHEARLTGRLRDGGTLAALR